MFEEFRKQTDDLAFVDDPHGPSLNDDMHGDRHFLGMSPAQRFIFALLLMLMTLILGVFFLLVTYKIVPPFQG